MACIVVACAVMADIVGTCTVLAYVVIAYIVMVLSSEASPNISVLITVMLS